MKSISFAGTIDDTKSGSAWLAHPILNKWLVESGVKIVHVAQSQTVVPGSTFLHGHVKFVVTIFYEE